MTENTPHNNHLDNYLLGKLSPADKAAMDAKLAVDSHLREEVQLQQDIVNALQDTRRLELKNRLNNIEVGAGGFSSAVGYQLAAGISMVALIGTGVFLYFSAPSTTSTELPFQQIELAGHDQLPSYSLPAQPEVIVQTQEMVVTQPQQESITPAAEITTPKSATVVAVTAKPVTAKTTTEAEKALTKAREVQVQKPKVLSDFKDADLSAGVQQPDAPVDVLSRNRQFSNKSIEVSAQPHDKYNFHYRFFESRLYIFGDFKNKPYEILEINTEGATNYYLYFESNYYGLNTDQQKITKLKRIGNEKLIKELEITRTQK